MLGDYLRKKSSKFVTIIGKLFGFLPISANAFSGLAIIWAICFTWLVNIENMKWLAFLFFVFAVFWDAIDGAFAKYKNDVTKFGYYVEGIIDKWVEIILYLGIFLLGYQLEIFLFSVATLMLSFAKPRAAMVIYIGEFDWPAIGERLERLIVLTIGLIIYLFEVNRIQINDWKIDLFSMLIWINFVIVMIGEVQRIFFAKKMIDEGGIDKLNIKDRLK